MFEIHVGELRATFLRNHNMRRRKDPKRKAAQAEDNSSPEDSPSRRQLKLRKRPHPRQPPQLPEAQGHYTRYGALHPLRGAAPDQGRCTRYVAVHPLRGGAPVTWRCTRYVAAHPNRRGALPTDRVQRPNKQEQTRNWHTEPLTAAPLHAQLGPTGGRSRPRCPRRPRRHLHSGPRRHLHSGPRRHLHSGPLRHLPHPYMRRASKRPGSRQRPRPLRL